MQVLNAQSFEHIHGGYGPAREIVESAVTGAVWGGVIGFIGGDIVSGAVAGATLFGLVAVVRVTADSIDNVNSRVYYY